jgi:F-type H+-transporting ATPase subunit delta
MRQTKVASRYAKALFDIALEKGSLEAVKADIDLINSIHHRELEVLLASPVVNGERKVAIFEAVFSKHVSALTVSFFTLIFDKGRSIAIKDILESFVAKYKAHKGIEVVEVTTAIALDDEGRSQIRNGLKDNLMLKGKTIELKEKVDAEIIGGLVVQVEDKLFDASIRHDLQFIKRQFIKNIYIKEIR